MATPDSGSYRWGLRLALVAFLAYCAFTWVSIRSVDADSLLSIAFRGLFAGGLVLGASWVILPVIGFLYGHLIRTPLSKVRLWFADAKRKSQERQARREQERERRRANKEYQRQAPEREQAQREADVRAQQLDQDNRRRADARASCEILYALHAPEISTRFSKQHFDDFVARHLGDDHPPEYVEERARQLQEIITKHLEKVEPSKKAQSLDELVQWYKDMQAKIDSLPLDDKLKRNYRAQLNTSFQQLMAQQIQEMQ